MGYGMIKIEGVESAVVVGPAAAGARRPAEAVLECVALSKVYCMGEVEVHTLRSVDGLCGGRGAGEGALTRN
jgi:hypothetical protein